jgi:hypothetical protein
MPKVIRTDKKGLHQKTGKGMTGVMYTAQTRVIADSGGDAYVTAGAPATRGITQPAKSVLLDCTVEVTTALAFASGVCGVRVGTAAGDEDLVALTGNTDSLTGTATALAVGKGTSSHSIWMTSMGGVDDIPIVANSGYSATERQIHPEVVPAGGSITAGIVTVWCSFLQFDGDA